VSSRFRERLVAGERLIGTILSLPSPEVTEILAAAGFDWLFLDTEHAPLGPRTVVECLRAAGPCPVLVRVGANEEAAIKQALDAGAAGVIVPQVAGADEARRAVVAARYPPDGRRGVGVARAQGYGFDFERYVAAANEAVVVVAQVESAEGVAQVDAIAALQGLDAIFIGPYDLAASLGHMGEPDHPEAEAAIERVRERTLAAGRRLGIFGTDANALRARLERGYTLIAVGIDALLLGRAARDALRVIRGGW